jgi:hypothetical protein
MPTRSTALTLLIAATLALGSGLGRSAWAESSATPHPMSIAQAESTAPDSPAPEGETAPDPKTMTNPNDKHAVTPAEIAECMKTWDPQTGMSKSEYEQSCKSTLKYYPEKP